MPRMKRLTMGFPEALHREMKRLARRRRVSVAQVVRDAVAQHVWRLQIPFGTDPMNRHVGVVVGLPDDESVNHDHYLYGWARCERPTLEGS